MLMRLVQLRLLPGLDEMNPGLEVVMFWVDLFVLVGLAVVGLSIVVSVYVLVAKALEHRQRVHRLRFEAEQQRIYADTYRLAEQLQSQAFWVRREMLHQATRCRR